MQQNSALDFLQEYTKKTNPLLEQYLEKKIEEAKLIGNLPADLLTRMAKIAHRGKKIRGSLVVLGYQLAKGKDLSSIYDVSIFIELLHLGGLIHDDIMDEDSVRRGLPTLHTQFSPKHFGESVAINAGDLAFYLSWEKLLDSNFPPNQILEAGKIYADYVLRLIHGQILDIANTWKKKLSDEEILHIFRYKTAEYTGILPLLIGAKLAGMDNKEQLNSLKEFGLYLGWTFQIQDDILGMYGEEKQTGKPTDSDLRKGKTTLFVWYMMEYGSPKDRMFLQKIIEKKNITDQDVIRVRELFKKTGAYDYAANLGWDYVKKAKRLIPKLTHDKNLQNLLESFVRFMMDRVK